MDFLFQIGRFSISEEGLTLSRSSIGTCHTPAVLRASIAPDPPLVGLITQTNIGNFYASLDTGAVDVGYVMGNWEVREKLGVKGRYKLERQSARTLSEKNNLGFVNGRIELLLDGDTFDRELRFYPNLSLNTDIVMSRAALKDFSFYYDLPRGMACIHANDRDATKSGTVK